MPEVNQNVDTAAGETAPLADMGSSEAAAAASLSESQYSWTKLFLQPVLFLAAAALSIFGLGLAQKYGWISARGGGSATSKIASAADAGTRYICPMMCTPPQAEPGRCPVCAMELVPATSGGGQTDSRSVQIDPVARRLANIHTATAKSISLERTIRAVGQLNYDEGSLKTISAYVDGRLDRLYADYTGVVVEKGDHLAWLYSPRLYSAQVELLLARKSLKASQSTTLERVYESNQDLYENAKQRLIELGVTEEQIEELERAGEANSRMHLCAPISGTVIEKLAVEGQYVKVGQPIYHLADLSKVWLMLELFPEDAAVIREGQEVEAEVHSLPGRKFTGLVAFLDPTVDPKKRTVGVRVVIANDEGLLRTGDYAKATIRAPVTITGDLVLVVPRSAVLRNAEHSVVYVETEPGRFEIRHVTLGATCGDQVAVLDGLEEGVEVATSGNFLIDSQMQLAGNPSLIDPMKAQPKLDEPTPEVLAALTELSEEDRAIAERQRVCPVTMFPLGSMGLPPKVDVDGRIVFICCEGCREALLEEPEKYLAKLTADSTLQEAQAAPSQPELPPMGEMSLLDDPEVVR